jgi:hypothetical protein
MIILDACMIIAFGNAGRFDLIDGLQLDSVCVGTRARGEVVRDPARAIMGASIAAGHLRVVEIDLENSSEQDALRRYDARPAFRDRGDAEVLALAECRGYIAGSDERAIRSVVVANLGPTRVAGTLDFFRWAVAEGRLSLADAAQVLGQLDSGVQILAQITARGQQLHDLLQ